MLTSPACVCLLTSGLLSGTAQADKVGGGSCCVSDRFHDVVVFFELLYVS
jgi:hypothetical protein